ncbi:hypothetical protein ACFL1H_06700 [Nanoarchaeota archaeon]
MARMKSAAEIAKSPMLQGILFQVDKKLRYLDLHNKFQEFYFIKDEEDEYINKFVEFNDDIYYCGTDMICSLFNGFSTERDGRFGSLVLLNDKLYDLYQKEITETLTDKFSYKIDNTSLTELLEFNGNLFYTRQDTGSKGGDIYKVTREMGKFKGRKILKDGLKHDQNVRILSKDDFISSDNYRIALNDKELPECYSNGQNSTYMDHIECFNHENDIVDIYYTVTWSGLYKAQVNVKKRKLISKEIIHNTGKAYRRFLLVQNENIHNRLIEMGENNG